MSNAVAGVGAEFQRYTGGEWVALAEVSNIDLSGARDVIDVTSFDSLNGYREHIGGYRDGGEVNFTMIFNRSDYDIVKDDYDSDDIEQYRVVLTDTDDTTLTFSGFINKLEAMTSTDDKITSSVTVKVSGSVVLGIAIPSIISDGNTVAWYLSDEPDTITKDGANRVSQWDDYLGSGHDLIQATGADQPLWSSDGILFDGVSEFMKTVFTLIQPISLYIVVKQITWTSTEYILAGIDSSVGLVQHPIANQLMSYSGRLDIFTDWNLDIFSIVRSKFNHEDSSIQINKQPKITGNSGAQTPWNGIVLGANYINSNFSNIEVKEIILRKIVDTSTNEQDIYDYLANKYSI